MKVTIDQTSGFCFGVVRAIETAENNLEAVGGLYCLGDIVHNNMEVERLAGRGMKVISREEFSKLKDCRVLIRAHGEPPETYEIAKTNNITLIDASCPIVLKLQDRVKNAYAEMQQKNGQVVIYGKKGHAEVIGLAGQTDNTAIIVDEDEDLDQIDYKRPVRLFAQTTKNVEGLQHIENMIRLKIKKEHPLAEDDFKSFDTVCRQVANRSIQIKAFAQQSDVILFVSDKKSSNGIQLYNYCKSVNPRCHFISNAAEIRQEWFTDASSCGICGATSTPLWLMEEIAEIIQKY